MTSDTSTFALPLRSSLTDQVVILIRQGIAAARWKNELPSEAELCRELQVSRVTLRRALEQLIRERIVTPGGRGRHHRIGMTESPVYVEPGRVIRVLTPYSVATMGGVPNSLLESFGERVAKAGYRVEYEYHKSVFNRFQPEKLARLDSMPGTAGWVLFYPTEQMQQWFAERGRPCVTIGRVYDHIELSSVGSDVEALARHAVGLLHARGYRDLVYLIAEFTSLNDRITSEVFAEETKRLGIRGQVITHPADPAGLRRVLTGILASRPRPTAFVSSCPEHCLTILCQLLNAGLRVPADAAVVSCWEDVSLQYTIPSIAHYKVDGAQLGRKTSTVLLDLLQHGTSKLQSLKIMPEFVPGETLAGRVV